MDIQFHTDIKGLLQKQEKILPIETDVEPFYSKDPKIKAAVFDIYGTLLISSSGDIDHATFNLEDMQKAVVAGNVSMTKNKENHAVSFLLENLPAEIIAQKKEIKEKMGHPFPEVNIFKVWESILKKAASQSLVHFTGNESLPDMIIVFEMLSNKVYPMPGMLEMLKHLKSKGIPLGIVSNAQFYTPIIVNYFMSGEFSTNQYIDLFDPDISVFSFKELKSKPDTSIFERIKTNLLEKYGIQPHETIFVGNDMLKDIYTATKAGLKTIFFAGDQRSLRFRENDERVKNIVPEHTITKLNQIIEILGI